MKLALCGLGAGSTLNIQSVISASVMSSVVSSLSVEVSEEGSVSLVLLNLSVSTSVSSTVSSLSEMYYNLTFQWDKDSLHGPSMIF